MAGILAGQNAIVTGASRGFGKAIAFGSGCGWSDRDGDGADKRTARFDRLSD